MGEWVVRSCLLVCVLLCCFFSKSVGTVRPVPCGRRGGAALWPLSTHLPPRNQGRRPTAHLGHSDPEVSLEELDTAAVETSGTFPKHEPQSS